MNQFEIKEYSIRNGYGVYYTTNKEWITERYYETLFTLEEVKETRKALESEHPRPLEEFSYVVDWDGNKINVDEDIIDDIRKSFFAKMLKDWRENGKEVRRLRS